MMDMQLIRNLLFEQTKYSPVPRLRLRSPADLGGEQNV